MVRLLLLEGGNVCGDCACEGRGDGALEGWGVVCICP